MSILKKFLKDQMINQNSFSKQIRISQAYLSLILNGYRNPSPDLALRIEEATGGKVNRLDLLYPKEEVKSHAK